MDQHLSDTVLFLGFMGLFGFFLWLASKRAFTRADLLRLHLESRNHLVERFASSQDFLEFARSEEGHALLQAPQLPSPRPPAPAGLRLVQWGLLSMLVSLAFRETYYQALNWRAANLHFDAGQEWMSWNTATNAWFCCHFFLYAGLALFLGGLLAALVARIDRRA